MTKKLLLLFLSALIVFSFTACNSKSASIVDPQVIEELDADPYYKELKKLDGTRPIALMIDNDSDDARPQIGLEDAYMVYEMVVEGRATRFMALFKNFNLEKVGPIRSSRHYFLDYVLEHDAIYAHAGWSPKAANDIKSLKIDNINGVANDGASFWRDNTYDDSWHNLYSSTAKLSARADEKEYRRDAKIPTPDYNLHDETPSGGKEITSFSIPYANFYKVDWKYDEESKVFVRYINGKTHDSQTGKALTAKNIIMYTVENVDLPDTENKGRQDLKNVGSGTGYYFSDGQAVEINWSKKSRKAQTEYTLADGTPLKLNPGNTFIQIVPTYAKPAIEYTQAASAE